MVGTTGVPSGETANDVWDDGCIRLVVWVNETGASWKFDDICNTNSSSGAFAFSGIIQNPDISIVYDKGTNYYYALIVYVDPFTGDYIFDPHYLIPSNTSPTLDPVGTPIVLENGSFPNPGENGIRIDANSEGDFVIVWKMDSEIHTVSGTTLANAGPVICSLPKDLPIDGLDEFKWPDVGITEADQGQGIIFYAVLREDQSQVIITRQSFDTVCNEPIIYENKIVDKDCAFYTVQPPFGSTTGDFLLRPRIAVSRDRIYENYIVVMAYYDFDTDFQDIVGFASYNNVIYDHNYTNNTETELIAYGQNQLDQNNQQTLPAISFAFEGTAELVWVGGWDGLYPTEGTTVNPNPNYEMSIMGLSLDFYGNVACGTCIKHVTDDNFGNGNNMTYPSVAGRQIGTNRMMNVCWYDPNAGFVYHKDFEECGNNYRTPRIETHNVSLEKTKRLLVYPNPSSSSVTVDLDNFSFGKIYSMTITEISGRKFGKFTGFPNNLENNGSAVLSTLRSGVYIISVYDGNKVVATNKLVRY